MVCRHSIDESRVSPGTRQLLIAMAPAAGVRILSLGTDVADWLALMGTAVIVSWCWAAAFARFRDRPLDTDWPAHALIFALLLPATMPLGFAVVALSFGLVFGCHVFGGTGRYLVHPGVLGAVFVRFSWPALVDDTAWLAAEPNEPIWFAAACLLGALFLTATGRASAMLVGGGVIGAAVAGSLLGDLSPLSHLMLGHFAFALAFIATDPSTQPKTPAGCLISGVLFGLLTIVLRTADPDEPEGTVAALLLVSLVIPLIDRLTLRTARDSGPEAADAGSAPR